jgi:hypothetical protein
MRSALLLLVFFIHSMAYAQSDNSVSATETFESFHKGMLKALKKGGGNVLVDKNVFPPQSATMDQSFKATSGPQGYAIVLTYWADDGPPSAFFNYGSESAHDEYFKTERFGKFGAMILKMGNAPGRTGHVYLQKSGSCERENCAVHIMIVEY